MKDTLDITLVEVLRIKARTSVEEAYSASLLLLRRMRESID
jgi:hypothetical protein